MKPTVSTQKNPSVFSGHIRTLFNFWTLKAMPITTSLKWRSFMISMVALTLLVACQGHDDLIPQDPVNSKMEHQIEFRVVKAKDYTEEAYDGAKATLNLTISLENMSDGKNTILWDTVFNLREIREFPSPSDPLLIHRDISRIANNNEILRLSNTVRYFDRNNSTWMDAKGGTVPRNFRRVMVDVVI